MPDFPALLTLAALATAATAPALSQPLAPKVMVVTMFGEETAPWLENEALDRKVEVPGLAQDYPAVACDADGLCVMTTAMGYANAASSVSALVYGDAFDLSRTYFLIAGIAGVDPEDGTLGSAKWARYVVDGDLHHEIDLRQTPEGWETGIFGLGASAPGEKPGWRAGTEVFELSAPLVERAFEVTRDVALADSDAAQDYRERYASDAATGAPEVGVCDTVSADTYWHGSRIGDTMQDWAALLTDGEANYCTSQMEDNATLTALRRGARAGLLDFDRVAVLRTASNFDRAAPAQGAADSLAADSGGFGPATENAYRVGMAFASEVIGDWPAWKDGVPDS